MNITALIVIFILFLLALLVMKIIGKMVRFVAITLVLLLLGYSGWFFLEHGVAPDISDVTGAATSIDAVNETMEKVVQKRDAVVEGFKDDAVQKIRDEMISESENTAEISIE